MSESVYQKWTPFGVALDIRATVSDATRTSASQFTVKIVASWETYYSGAKTNYGMTASAGGVTHTISAFDGTSRSSGSVTFTRSFSVSTKNSYTKVIPVTFRNFNSDNGDSATKELKCSVVVPAWPSYTISYNANGGSGAPANQTKWKDEILVVSLTKPTKAGYTFLGWSTSSTATTATYTAGSGYGTNASATLYAVWSPQGYTVSYNANGGNGAPGNQTKTHGTPLRLSLVKPTRTNYTFLGWSTTSTATTAMYSAGDQYNNNAAVTLYAVWSLAYIKPRIYNLTINRSDSNGNTTDEGTSALVSFEWESDTTVSSIVIKWKLPSESTWSSATVSASGTSGTVSSIVGSNSLNTESSYDIHITVSDSSGSSYAIGTLTSGKFAIDFLNGGSGVSFGKAAEYENTAEFAFDAKFNKPVYGKALGMDRLPAIPNGADFNSYMDPGCYAVYSNAIADSCVNIPVYRAGRLEVWSATGEGVRSEQWSYLRQRYIPYNSGNAVWEREMTRGEDNVWTYYEWWRSSLTPEASKKVYSKAAMTIALSTNTTLGVVNVYTEVPLDRVATETSSGRLTLASNSIRIGSNIQYIKVSGQVLLKCGSTNGNRHVRIQKISGSNTVNIAWDCVYATATSNTLYPLTPRLINVNEGDIIRMVFYTSDTADQIASGSAANGWQTYLTVEEL